MTKSQKVRERQLCKIEGEFMVLLHSCLRECTQGRHGLFGQNDHLDLEGRYCAWPEAKRLRNLALEIKSLRQEFGQTNEPCERFIQLCSLRGSNGPGETKLAVARQSKIELLPHWRFFAPNVHICSRPGYTMDSAGETLMNVRRLKIANRFLLSLAFVVAGIFSAAQSAKKQRPTPNIFLMRSVTL